MNAETPLSLLNISNINTNDLRPFDPQTYKQSECPIHNLKQEKVSKVPQSGFPYPISECLFVPYDDDTFDKANRALESIFASIECLTATFDACCCRWRLHYGTPMACTLNVSMSFAERCAVRAKNNALYELLLKIYKKIPNPNVSEQNPWGVDFEDDPFEKLKPRREFCIAEVVIIRRQRENGQDMLSINFNRVCGSRVTALFILTELKRNIKTTFENTHLTLHSRLPVLQFAEGTQFKQEDHPQISRYVLNDSLVRELCAFIPYRKFI